MLSNQAVYTVVLSHPFGSRWYEEKLPRKRGSPSSWNNGKNHWPFCPSQLYSHVLWLSRLDQVDPAGRVKVFVWRNVGSARRVTLPSQKGEPAARRVTLPAKATFFHIYTVLKINIWTLICCPYSFPTEVVGEVDKILSKFILCDHAPNSHDHSVLQSIDITRRNLMLITLRAWRVKGSYEKLAHCRRRIDPSTRDNFSPYKWA